MSELLASLGFEGEDAGRALQRLYREGLTRPGKSRIAAAKFEAVERTLGAAFVRHCRRPACAPARGERRDPVIVSQMQRPRLEPRPGLRPSPGRHGQYR